jgi:hypothetical protein
MNDFELQLPNNTLNLYQGVYPIQGMNAARKYLIETVYKTRSKSKIELVSKLKCGMLAQDVVDYFVHEKINAIDEKDFYGEEEDGEIEEFESSETETKSKETTQITSEIVEQLVCPTSVDQVMEFESNKETKAKNKSKSIFNSSENFRKKTKLKRHLSQLTNINHACKKECPENVNKTRNKNGLKLAFVCDLCWEIFFSQEKALFHINKCNHISASEFLMKRSASTKKFQFKSIVNRCSIKSSSINQSNGVFCPNRKCSFYFEYFFFNNINYTIFI